VDDSWGDAAVEKSDAVLWYLKCLAQSLLMELGLPQSQHTVLVGCVWIRGGWSRCGEQHWRHSCCMGEYCSDGRRVAGCSVAGLFGTDCCRVAAGLFAC
jgi:hypothetical protein